jgi:alcohol dehydrogenase
VANVGVQGTPASLHLESLWIKNMTITTGLVDTSSTPTLLRLIAEGRLDPLLLATHSLKFGEMLDAYDVFGNAGETERSRSGGARLRLGARRVV